MEENSRDSSISTDGEGNRAFQGKEEQGHWSYKWRKEQPCPVVVEDALTREMLFGESNISAKGHGYRVIYLQENEGQMDGKGWRTKG